VLGALSANFGSSDLFVHDIYYSHARLDSLTILVSALVVVYAAMCIYPFLFNIGSTGVVYHNFLLSLGTFLAFCGGIGVFRIAYCIERFSTQSEFIFWWKVLKFFSLSFAWTIRFLQGILFSVNFFGLSLVCDSGMLFIRGDLSFFDFNQISWDLFVKSSECGGWR
jgi:hypothetical protein